MSLSLLRWEAANPCLKKDIKMMVVIMLICFIISQLVSEKQQQFHADSLQLLFYQAPLSATLLMPVIPFFEPIFSDQGLLAVWSYEVMVNIMAITVYLNFVDSI